MVQKGHGRQDIRKPDPCRESYTVDGSNLSRSCSFIRPSQESLKSVRRVHQCSSLDGLDLPFESLSLTNSAHAFFGPFGHVKTWDNSSAPLPLPAAGKIFEKKWNQGKEKRYIIAGIKNQLTRGI